jgi:hypothetical protein
VPPVQTVVGEAVRLATVGNACIVCAPPLDVVPVGIIAVLQVNGTVVDVVEYPVTAILSPAVAPAAIVAVTQKYVVTLAVSVTPAKAPEGCVPVPKPVVIVGPNCTAVEKLFVVLYQTLKFVMSAAT